MGDNIRKGEEATRNLNDQIQYVLCNMRLVGLEPNKIQMAIAIAVAHMTATPGLSGSKKNHMVVVPPSKGKTRITMAIALLLLRKFTKAAKVVIVWPNEVLKNQDAEAWARVKGLFSDLGAELRLDVGLQRVREEDDKNALILVDEADKLFIDDMEEPPRKRKACIGFTATIPSGKEGKVVQNRLEKLNVKIWN